MASTKSPERRRPDAGTGRSHARTHQCLGRVHQKSQTMPSSHKTCVKSADASYLEPRLLPTHRAQSWCHAIDSSAVALQNDLIPVSDTRVECSAPQLIKGQYQLIF